MQEYTEKGNLKPRTRKLNVEWIIDVWIKLKDIIEKLLKACAHNVIVDGSDDSHFHCFREDPPCAAGYEKLLQQLHMWKDSSFNTNPFSETDVEMAAKEINLTDMDNNEEELIDIE